MSVWILMVWDCDDWEVLGVLFDAAAAEAKVKELFEENEDYTEIKVECWHRDDVDSPDASFDDVETYWRDDYVEDA